MVKKYNYRPGREKKSRTIKKVQHRHPSEYLNDLEEWQRYQYDPGHYLGGNINPQLKYASGTKAGKYFAALCLMLGVISGIGTVFTFIEGAGNILALLMTLLFISVGLTCFGGSKE